MKQVNKVNKKLISIWSVFILIGTGIFILEKTRHLFTIDSDIFWHIKTGEWILENGYVPKVDVFSWHSGLNWIPHEWLYDVFLNIIYNKFDFQGIIVLAAIMLFAKIAFCTVYNVIIKKENIQGYSIFVACMLIFTGYTWAVGRPLELTTIILLINLITFIKSRSKKIYYLSFCISCLAIANLHGGTLQSIFVQMIIFIIMDIAYYRKTGDIEHKKEAILKTKVMVAGILISLINPHGINIYSYAFKMLLTGAKEATSSIAEWQPMNFIGIVACVLFILVYISIAINKKTQKLNKEEVTKLAIITFWGIMMLRYCRCAPMFLFIVLLWGYPFIREFFEIVISEFKLEKILKIIKYLVVTIGIAFIIITAIMAEKWYTYYFKNDINELLKNDYPYNCLEYIKENNITTKLYCESIGSWLLFNDVPSFVDGRCDPFVNEFSPGNNQFIEVASINSSDDLLGIFEKYDIQYALLDNHIDMVKVLKQSNKWKVVCEDNNGTVFLLKRVEGGK